MRGKKAKALRRAANNLTIGRPYCAIKPYDDGSRWFVGTRRLIDNCTRKFIKHLKRYGTSDISRAAVDERIHEVMGTTP